MIMNKKSGFFKKIWDDSTTIEKANFVKEANLEGLVTIFIDLDQYPQWDQIETYHQSKIRDAIRKVKGC